MESPPSYSTHSEAPPLSEDSGLLITSGSFSSDSASGWHHIASELQESDFDERSLSLCESTETSERMGGDFFNTVKKGPGKVIVTPIEPPPEFQDDPATFEPIRSVSGGPAGFGDLASGSLPLIHDDNRTFEPIRSLSRGPAGLGDLASASLPIIHDNPAMASTTVVVPTPILATKDKSAFDLAMSLRQVSPLYPRKLKPESLYERRQCLNHRFASPRLLHLSPGRGNRPSSRNSLSSRLSSSHNSLVTQLQADDSSFITQAISHDTLSTKSSDIPDMYNVPFDSDIYAVPIDNVRPHHAGRAKVKKPQRNNKRRIKSTPQTITSNHTPLERTHRPKESRHKDTKTKRHSLPSSSTKKSATDSDNDSLKLTLLDMRKYIGNLYSSSSDSECKNTMNKRNSTVVANVGVHIGKHCALTNFKDCGKNVVPPVGTAVFLKESIEISRSAEANNNNTHKKPNRNSVGLNGKNKKHKDAAIECNIIEVDNRSDKAAKRPATQRVRMSTMRMLSMNLKQSFCNLFRWRRSSEGSSVERVGRESPPAAVRRALPPLPQSPHTSHARRSANDDDNVTDFATSIQKVKDYGWYWGPISVEAAEKILSNEPDGSFIVRDSSDDHYIFTLTFKLNGLRHVRIEHDQGNFCFGGCNMFKAQTIVEFIENAVETSRSGRYLFFLNLRPMLGPVRVQLLYPVSRFKRVQSLQHMCRFVILKYVRRDLICNLPLPRRVLDYLSATHYYSELLAEI